MKFTSCVNFARMQAALYVCVQRIRDKTDWQTFENKEFVLAVTGGSYHMNERLWLDHTRPITVEVQEDRSPEVFVLISGLQDINIPLVLRCKAMSTSSCVRRTDFERSSRKKIAAFVSLCHRWTWVAAECIGQLMWPLQSLLIGVPQLRG